MKYNVIFVMAIMLLYGGCKAPSPVQQYEKYDGAKLIIGSGGGFTGEYIDYIILENGYVFKKSTLDNKLAYLGKLKKNDVLQLFKNYSYLGLNKKNLNMPGNMNKYIKYIKDGEKHILQWSYEKSKMVAPEIKLFYKIAMKLAGQLK